MMNNIKISACIITYNHEGFIRECLEGAINQKVNFEYEIVIGEDNSSDRTRQICAEYAEKYPNLIKFYPREKNLGMIGNWINTIQNCSGKYIAICEGDDYWIDPLKLQKQVDFLEANSDYVLCFHQVNILKTNGEIVDDFVAKVPENYEIIETLARFGNYIHTPSVVFRNVIKEFPFEFSQSPIGDYFLYLLLAEQGKLKFLEDKMAIYRHGVGVYSGNLIVKLLQIHIKEHACILSYLSDENIKKIMLERNLNLASDIESISKKFYTSNNYLVENKSFDDVIKITIKSFFIGRFIINLYYSFIKRCRTK